MASPRKDGPKGRHALLPSPATAAAAAGRWFERHRQTMLIMDAVCIALLFLLHIFTATVPSFSLGAAVSTVAAALASLIFLTVVWKGVVPAVICALGIALMHGSIVLPYNAPPDPQFPDEFFNNRPPEQHPSAKMSFHVAVEMYFALGLAMVAMSMIIAYRPSLMFTKNRPQSVEEMWSKYPLWHDNVELVGGRLEPSVPALTLMDERDRYLMWRYEYVLADIYGRPHLVRPDGMVPQKSTSFVRDRASGLIMGVPRFTGYFA